jgi:hypothetical protein
MLTSANITFLQVKINELRSALFFSLTNAVLKMPTTIVSALKVDDVGQVWFFVNRPAQYIQEFDRQFPARLDFFRKGKRFFIKIAGMASIVNDPEEVSGIIGFSEEIKQVAMHQLLLVKVVIQQAEYYENFPVRRKNWFHRVKSQYRKLLHHIQSDNQPYQFQPGSLVTY